MSKQFGFSSKQHIRSADEFDHVFKLGARIKDSCFNLISLKTEHNYPRLGLVIAKRHCPRAVNRNRIKRLIREQFRLNQHAFSKVDLVMALRSSTEKMSDQELCTCVNRLFSQCIAR